MFIFPLEVFAPTDMLSSLRICYPILPYTLHPPSCSPLSSLRYARPFCRELLMTNPHILQSRLSPVPYQQIDAFITGFSYHLKYG